MLWQLFSESERIQSIILLNFQSILAFVQFLLRKTKQFKPTTPLHQRYFNDLVIRMSFSEANKMKLSSICLQDGRMSIGTAPVHHLSNVVVG